MFRLPEHIRRLDNSAKIYRMTAARLGAELSEAILRDHPGQRAGRLLHPPARLPRLRHAWASTPCARPSRSVIARLALGQATWARTLGAGGRRLRLLLAPAAPPGAARRWPRPPATTSRPARSRWRRSPTATSRASRSTRAATSARARARTSSWSADGALVTPPLAASLLPGITRDSVMILARDLGHRGARGADPARPALHLRRAVPDRHGGRDHARALGRPYTGGQRAARAESPAHPRPSSTASSPARSRTATAGSRRSGHAANPLAEAELSPAEASTSVDGRAGAVT